jgi:tripartite-type tricarboxylate transporter receptor subunit TctC
MKMNNQKKTTIGECNPFRRQWFRMGLTSIAGMMFPWAKANAAPSALEIQNYPNRPIRMISPWAVGGGTELIGRPLSNGLTKILGQSVIYENKPGGGTVIGSDLVAKAAPDGYTLMVTTSAHAINDALIKNLPYSAEQSFADIALICKGPMVIATKPDSPYRTVKDILTAAKANPGKLTYGSSGNGSAVHLAAELFKLMAKVDITHIPYKGGGPAHTDLLGGQIDFVFATIAGVAKYIDSGQMRGVAVTSMSRSTQYPKIPTVAESGVPDYESEVWYALFTTGGTPQAIVDKLNAATKLVVNTKEYRNKLEQDGLRIEVGSPKDLSRLIKSDISRWRNVIAAANVTID